MTKSLPSGTVIDADESVASRIRRAEAAIAGLKGNFADWVRADIDLAGVHLAEAHRAADPAVRARELDVVRRIVHNIKGQGGTFGCHGLSAAAAELDSLLKRPTGPSVLSDASHLVAKLNAAFVVELT